jgi:hypothetical protein
MKDIQPGIEAFYLLMHAYFGMNVKYCKSKHKTVPVLNSAPHYKDVWGSGGISLCILNHGTRRKLSGRLHILAISPPKGNSPLYHSTGSWEGLCAIQDAVEKRTCLLPIPGIEPGFSGHPV